MVEATQPWLYNNIGLFRVNKVYTPRKIEIGSAVKLFTGRGQVFNSDFGAFYLMNANVNDQIGEALLAAKSVHAFPAAGYEYTSSIPNPSTVVPTTVTHSQALTFTSTESEGDTTVDTEDPPTVNDKSGMTETSTHPKTCGTIFKDE